MPIHFSKYHIYEYFDGAEKGTGYNGGEHLKEARSTSWKQETSKQRMISVHKTGKDYIQLKDGTVYQLFHVDYWDVKGKERKLYGQNPDLYETLDEARKACEELVQRNPQGRKRNYTTYTVREENDDTLQAYRQARLAEH